MSDYWLTVRVENQDSVHIEGSNIDSKTYRPDFTPLRQATIEVFETLLAKEKIEERKEVEVLGTHLYEAIFPEGEGRSLLNNMYKTASTKQKRLRLQLRFDKGAHLLEDLPWEFMYFPEQKSFFAIATDLILTRYMPNPGTEIPDTLEPGNSPLKILVVVTEPKELEPVYAQPLKEEIKKLEITEKVEIHELDNPTMDQWSAKLEEFKPHIVHWIGHGQVNQKKEAEVALVDEDGNLVWCLDMIFAEKFKELHSIPRLVVLQVCESAKVKSTGFAGVAPWLVQFQVPAVVAMQYPIKQKAAIAFSRAFYQSLAKGEEVDDAFQNARKRMVTDNLRFSDIRDIGTPILYWRSRRGIILRADESSPQAPLQQPRSPAEGSTGLNWAPEARRMLDIGNKEIHNWNTLQAVERLTLYTELRKLCADFSQYRDSSQIRDKILELSQGVSDPNLREILVKMYEAER